MKLHGREKRLYFGSPKCTCNETCISSFKWRECIHPELLAATELFNLSFRLSPIPFPDIFPDFIRPNPRDEGKECKCLYYGQSEVHSEKLLLSWTKLSYKVLSKQSCVLIEKATLLKYCENGFFINENGNDGKTNF